MREGETARGRGSRSPGSLQKETPRRMAYGGGEDEREYGRETRGPPSLSCPDPIKLFLIFFFKKKEGRIPFMSFI